MCESRTHRRLGKLAMRRSQFVPVLVLFCTAACTSLGKPATRPNLEPFPGISADYRLETLRAALREYSITFAAQVDSAASAIERRATDAAVKRAALVWRLRAIPEMRQA